jgi:tetratricopeptide (TPR) repeat protein
MNGQHVIGSRFVITGTIGQGGMGEVYRGQDLETGETVAIKLLKPDIIESDPSLIERFTREGEALRRLNHPNIVKMLAMLEEDNMHYIVMEYVSGGSLQDLLDRQPQLPVERVLSIALELADALTRAHHLKIIHRDLKPANVLLAEDGTPRLTDFGVARLGERTRVTVTGSVIGTYYYLSPEACMGEDLDQRTDIWSFGVMLYEMLAGRRPFDEEHSAAILIAILNNPVPDLAALRPDAPPDLVDLIYRMLEKDRDQRIPSIRLVGAALEAIIQGIDTPFPSSISTAPNVPSRFSTPTPPTATPAPVSDEDDTPTITLPSAVTAQPRRAVWLVGALAGLLVIAVVLVGVLGLFSGDDESGGPPESEVVTVEPVGPGEYMVLVAQLEPLGGVEQRDVTRFIVEDLRDHLENEVSYSTLRVREYPNVITSDEGALAAAEANAAAVVVWGNYTPDFVELEVQVGSFAPFPYIQFERETLTRIANVRTHLTDERRESVVTPVLTLLTVLQTADGDGFEVARTVSVHDAVRAENPEIVSGGAAGQLQQAFRFYLDDTAQAIVHYNAALDAVPANALLYTFRGSAYLRLGEFDKAVRDFESAQRLGTGQWATPLDSLGVYHITTNDLDQALQDLDRVVTLRPDDWFPVTFRGSLYYLQGDYATASTDLARALELGPEANFPYFPLAMMALREGRMADAQTYWQTAIAQFPDMTLLNRLMNAMFGDQLPNIFGSMFAAAGNLVLGQYQDAITEADKALAINDTFAEMDLVQGLAYCVLRDYAAAEEAYTRGIAIAPDFTVLYALRAEARMRQEDMAGALADAALVQQSPLSDTFDPLIEAGFGGAWSCEDFFSYDYSTLGDSP